MPEEPDESGQSGCSGGSYDSGDSECQKTPLRRLPTYIHAGKVACSHLYHSENCPGSPETWITCAEVEGKDECICIHEPVEELDEASASSVNGGGIGGQSPSGPAVDEYEHFPPRCTSAKAQNSGCGGYSAGFQSCQAVTATKCLCYHIVTGGGG